MTTPMTGSQPRRSASTIDRTLGNRAVPCCAVLCPASSNCHCPQVLPRMLHELNQLRASSDAKQSEINIYDKAIEEIESERQRDQEDENLETHGQISRLFAAALRRFR